MTIFFKVFKRVAGRGDEHGFTLIELLVTISIIGLLATAGSVTYSSARAQARDTKRIVDIKQLQVALETFYDKHDHYPDDLNRGQLGNILGAGMVLSDAGFTRPEDAAGLIYMATVPSNPEPYGASYVFRSLDADGKDCYENCQRFALLFWLEHGDDTLSAGPYVLSSNGIDSSPDAYVGQDVSLGGKRSAFVDLADRLNEVSGLAVGVAKDFAADKTVQTVTEVGVAPAAGVLAVLNAGLTGGAGFYNLLIFLLQPFQLLGRRRPRAWGVVYNSLSHLPEDLAIVRLLDAVSNRVLRTQVTDKEGRFSFLIGPGRYRLNVVKRGFAFPSQLVSDGAKDVPFEDAYAGREITVSGEGAVIAAHVPVDPPQATDSEVQVRKVNRKERQHGRLASLSLWIGLLAFVVRPTVFTGLLLAAQFVTYLLFRRLATRPEIKNWGVVWDVNSKRPVGNALVRVFAANYNKLLEMQVTDRLGRYHFRVGNGRYYLTAMCPGYFKTETEPIDLTRLDGATVIASDLPIRRNTGEKTTVANDVPTKVSVAGTVPIGSTAVEQLPESANREVSLENIMPQHAQRIRQNGAAAKEETGKQDSAR